MRKILKTCVLLVLCVVSSALHAASDEPLSAPLSMGNHSAIIEVPEAYKGETLSPEFDYYRDTHGNLSVEQIVLNQEQLFTPLLHSSKFGFTTDAIWVRMVFANPTEKYIETTIRQDYPLIDQLDFWLFDGNQILQHNATGDTRIFSSRMVDYPDFLFPIKIPGGESRTVIFRFQSSGPVNIGLTLLDQRLLIHQIVSEQLTYGVYYGGFIVLAVYNAFLFFAAKQKSYVHYLWYLLSYGTYMSVHNGLAFQYLWPGNPWLANQSLLVLLCLSLFWGLKFSMEILDSRQYSPRLYQLSEIFLKIIVVAFVASFIFSYASLILLISMFTFVIAALILAMGIISWLSGYKPARFFMIAWSTLLLAVIVYMLKSFGWLPHNVYTQNAFQIASLIEMTLLAIALSYHFRELQKDTYTDALTFLNNRRLFDERFKQEFDLAKETGRELSLMVIDIDHFKQFNDTHGHDVGDKVLRFVGKILRDTVRKPLIPCRYGGEEFVVILPRASKKDTLVLAERLRQQIEKNSQIKYQITVSIGVACNSDASINSRASLFKSADNALYQAKEAGRNRVIAAAEAKSETIDIIESKNT